MRGQCTGPVPGNGTHTGSSTSPTGCVLCYDLLRGSGSIPDASFLDRLLVREERLLSLLLLFGGTLREPRRLFLWRFCRPGKVSLLSFFRRCSCRENLQVPARPKRRCRVEDQRCAQETPKVSVSRAEGGKRSRAEWSGSLVQNMGCSEVAIKSPIG